MSNTLVQQSLDRAFAALEAGSAERAWQELAALEPAIDHDTEAAAAWLDLLRQTPKRATLPAEARRILDRFPEDPALVTRACDALIRAAELTPPDEPRPEDDPAQLAAAAAERCLSALGGAAPALRGGASVGAAPALRGGASVGAAPALRGGAALNPRGEQRDMRGYLLVSRANALRLAHNYDDALTALEAALAEHPERGAWWFNLGLLHKARHAFREGLAANRQALALLGDERPVLWNLAICAVAVGEGAIAVEALRKLGHDAQLAASGMPYVDGLPPVQVRAATLGSGLGTGSHVQDRSVGLELLWIAPISPCHGVVSSASYREASIDYGDVVLWDATPIGVTTYEGKPVPRFPLLSVLRKGDERRFRFVGLQQAEGEVAALARDLPEGAQIFIHREQVEMLCPRCASGEHMHKHTHAAPEEHRLVYGKLVLSGSTDLPAFRRELDTRLRAHSGVQIVVPGLLEAIGDTAAAGKAHQMWRGLERSAQKRVH